MPAPIYQIARKLEVSSIANQGQRPSGERTFIGRGGMRAFHWQDPFLSSPQTRGKFMVVKNNYKWGERITRRMLREAGASKADQKRYEGMYKMKGQGGASSGYITFRILMEGQTGWILPAKPGLYIAQKVSQGLLADAEKVFAGALSADLASA